MSARAEYIPDVGEGLDLHIRFEARTWKDYYPGGNNKYPPVYKLEVPKSLEHRMMLFHVLQAERASVCDFHPDRLKVVGSIDPEEGRFPIVIPSGGKQPKWLGRAAKRDPDVWWARLLGDEANRIIFVVSSDELEVYASVLEGLGITVVGYDGFGIGCGRAAAVNVIRSLQTTSIITDDRTLDFQLLGKTVSPSALNKLVEAQPRTWVASVGPFFRCNVLTVFNPAAESVTGGGVPFPTFPAHFIASKEDLALARFLEVRHDSATTHINLNRFSVRTDTRNPTYENVDVDYGRDRKGAVLEALTNSTLYRDLSGKPFTWANLTKIYGFLNKWDAIKMQEAAMYQLLDGIVTDLALSTNADDHVHFATYVEPWFQPR